MSAPEFVHLHNHTEYSLLDGAIRVEKLVEQAQQFGMPAVAITDHGNLFGAIQFYRTCRAAEIKPIIGVEAYVAPGSRFERSAKPGEAYHHLILLCQDRRGWSNLLKLVSIGYQEGFYYKPRIDKEVLARHSEGLIATSSCLKGEVNQLLMRGQQAAAEKAVGEYTDIFGAERFFLELQDQGLEAERRILPDVVALSRKLGLGLVATNDCHYLTRDDAYAHEVLLCIQTGSTMENPERFRFSGDQFHFRSPAEMARVFGELPEALRNTVAVAERCDLQLDFGNYHLPQFQVPEGATVESHFEAVARAGFERRLARLEQLAAQGRLRQSLDEYRQRFQSEVELIQQMGFAGYFLVVWDFIRYAKERGIPVGPGRGSAAGSLVAYALGITEVDPLQYDLLFERFLNPERISLPDIDIDFCIRGRGEVIEYVTNKYGRENVAQIITFGTMMAKAAIRDTARGLNLSYGEADRIAKLVPNEIHITIEQALESNERFRELAQGDDRVRKVIDTARKLEGMVRHASTHAAGVVIAPRPLTEFVPLYRDTSGQVTTQFAMEEIEQIGLLKMDFLGLRTLTVLADAVALVRKSKDPTLELEALALEDAETYNLFQAGRTAGIFQFESAGMRELLRKFKPSVFEHLIALNALYRPGPLGSGMIDDFIKRKDGKVKVSYPLPQLEPILNETFGVIVYQEQVMRIASTLAGFSLGEADILRRAMGKKKKELMADQATKFLAGCQQRGIPQAKAQQIFDLMEQFAGYGFNKSHSTAYALVAYYTAYLKNHYPVEFMAALLTSEKESTDKVVQYINECKEMGIAVLPPDVNTSESEFSVVEGTVRFGLSAVKNVGVKAVESILLARNSAGPFHSFIDFCERVDPHQVNKRVVESLIKCGAFDGLGLTRARLMAGVDRALELAARRQLELQHGQGNLFGDQVAPAAEADARILPELPEWPEEERLAYEKETLGYYVSGHPLTRYQDEIARFADVTVSELGEIKGGKEVTVGGILTAIKPRRTRAGERMAIAQFEDMNGLVEVVILPAVYAQCSAGLSTDEPLLVRGRVVVEESGVRLKANEFITLEQAAERFARKLWINIPLEVSKDSIFELSELVKKHPGETEVLFRLIDPERFEVEVQPHFLFKVQPGPELRASIERLFGSGAVSYL